MRADLPSTFTGSPRTTSNPLAHQGVTRARWRSIGSLLIAGALAITLAVSDAALASADELTDQLSKVNSQIDKTKQAMDQANAQLATASARLQDSKTRLAAAQAALVRAQSNVTDALARDRAAADALKAAQAALVEADRKVAEGEANLAEQLELVGRMARDQYQQSSPLLDLAVIFGGQDTSDLSSRLQWVTTMNSSTQAQMERLQDAQKQLNAAKQRQAEFKKNVQAAKDAADKQLATTKSLQAQATAKQAEVTKLVAVNEANQKAAAALVAAEKKRLAALQAEQNAVQARIAARIRAGRGYNGPMVGGFIRPVNGPVTSPYGMRFHPVLLVWKLHDGEDFGAACGTPIKAAAAGVVSERYYNAGYGNRLMIDHGYKNGIYITTGYNHATHYIVNVGQKVVQGQVIGYVGSTGYSTGCHLHLMVWEKGVVINPAKYFGT